MEGYTGLLIFILWPIIGAILCYMMKKREYQNIIAVFVTAVEFFLMLRYYFLFSSVKQSSQDIFWIGNGICGSGLSFRLDGFRVLYGLITTFAWFIAALFSTEYEKKETAKKRSYFFFQLFTLGATMGIFLSADFFTTFIFFEIMSVSSYTWVAYRETKKAREASVTYLFVSIIGGMIQLMGLFLLNHLVGTLEFNQLFKTCQNFLINGGKESVTLYIAGLCILVGFGIKAGMFPLHFWMPGTYRESMAPSSALFSAILSKTGLFGILILSIYVFSYSVSWGLIILVIGTITMIAGAILAIFSIDLKKILAYSSMSQIGFILVGIGMIGILGLHNKVAIDGTILYMLNHSIIKLVLFFIAGIVFLNLGELDLNKIKGFGKNKPFLKFSFLMAALGIGGIPFWNGYISKTLLHESIVEYLEELEPGGNIFVFFHIVEWIFLIAGGLTIAYMLKLFFALFVEKGKEKQPQKKKYMGKTAFIAIGICSIIIPILGFFPHLFMDNIAEFAEDFFRVGGKSAYLYFTFANLKGIGISILVGLAVYFFIIQRYLMVKNRNQETIYLDLWPKWMNLEKVIYRPIFLSFLPFLFAIVSRAMDQLVDGSLVLARKTIYANVKLKEALPEGTKLTYVLGTIFDDIARFLNKTILRKRPIKRSFVHTFAVKKAEMDEANPIIATSMSFGLLLVCIGLCLTLLYLLLA